MSTASAVTGTGVEAEQCGRCGQLVTRSPGGAWADQWGGAECPAPLQDWGGEVIAGHLVCKPPVRARSTGHATHNGATTPGELEVTVRGTLDGDPDQEVAMIFTEDALRALLAALSRYGFP